jgi:hypothetical protein
MIDENLKFILIGYPIDLQIISYDKFGNLYDFNEIKPYLTVHKYKNKKEEKENILKLIDNSTFDYASRQSKPKPDGKKDLLIELRNINFEGNLNFVEINITGKNSFIWNTNIFDVFPGIVIKKKNKLYKNETGKLNLSLKKGDTLEFFMYKPKKLSYNEGDIFIKLIVDNHQYNFKLKRSDL